MAHTHPIHDINNDTTYWMNRCATALEHLDFGQCTVEQLASLVFYLELLQGDTTSLPSSSLTGLVNPSPRRHLRIID